MKKTKFRRFTTLILSLVMLCTGFTLQSSADGTDSDYLPLYGDFYASYTWYSYTYNGYSNQEKLLDNIYWLVPREEGLEDIYSLFDEDDVADLCAELDSEYDADYPNAHRIKSADLYYNAHFYSFFRQDDSFPSVWIEDPTYYMGNYKWQYEVYYDYHPRDIVCYYHDNGTPEYEFDDVLIHTGIISGYSPVTQSNGQCGDIDLYMVDSKWGVGGVYRHNGYECPYTNYNTDNDGELRANKIRIFRLPNHEICDNTEDVTYEQHDSVLHQSICPCGQIIYEPHDIQRVIIDYGMNSIAPDAGTNAIVPPPLEDMICVDCGYRP